MVRSHPHKLLSEHIADVLQATRWILERHTSSSTLGDELFRRWAERLCTLHDLGKGSQAFQRYIRDPQGFSEPPRTKAHTPLSLVLSSLLLEQEGCEEVLAWGVLQAVLCHHGYLRTRRELMGTIDDDTAARILHTQLEELDIPALAQSTGEALLELDVEPEAVHEAADYLEDCQDALDRYVRASFEKAVELRLWSQLLFSVLLEADKALLAIQDAQRYQEEREATFLLGQVDDFIAQAPEHPINQLRQQARIEALETLACHKEERVFSLCLPTGLGKTLTAASCAFWLREHIAPKSKIVVVMPFLSVIDQTEEVYRKVLGMYEQGSAVMSSHSLSKRSFDTETNGSTADFFLDTWRSQLILTTYDQLLLSLMSPKGRHQMRLHQLCDAILIFDELQTMPCRLWKPFEALLSSLCVQGNSHVIAMSATLPEVLKGAQPLLSEEQVSGYFGHFGRYRLCLDTRPLSLDDFIEGVVHDILAGAWDGKRILLTLNTRKSARAVRDQIEESCGQAPYFLTADVTPKERLDVIDTLKRGGPCIVVATQCIEAGVDLDFDEIVRDFAPLDSLIQIAGRCNRNSQKERCDVHVVSLRDNKSNRPFYKLIYDEVHIDATYQVLRGVTSVDEEQVLALSASYFQELERRKDTGMELLRKYILWEEHPNVRELLRGEQGEQYSFVILREECPEERALLMELERLESDPMSFGDKWDQRRALKRLAAAFSRYTVSVYAKGDFEPSEIAERRLESFWLVESGWYEPGHGLFLPDASQHSFTI